MATKSRTLVKLDDKVLEIVQGAKGLKAKYLSDDDLAEVSLLDEGVESLIENDINKITNQAYEELKNSFKHTLKNNVLKIVGFEDRWNNKWEVDHCNGRSSLLTEYMSEKVKAMFREEFDKLLQSEAEEMLKTAKKAFVAEYASIFQREVKEIAYKEARSKAEAFVKEVAGKQIQKYQKDLIKGVELSFLGRPAKLENEDY
jgi:hypothetical protein